MRESAPNFSLLMDQGEETPKELQLESIPSHGSPEKANALFGRVKVTEQIKNLRIPYFELLSKGLSEARNQESGRGTEILITNRSKPFAGLEARLIATLAPLGDMYRSEQDINNAIRKLQENYQDANFDQSLDPKLIAKYFPTGRGLFNALECYRGRSKMPLPPNYRRAIFLQAELDAKSDTDFIEVIYGSELDQLKIAELNFIQVKSSIVDPSKLANIQRKHEEVATELAGNFEKAQQRYYPELHFEDQESLQEAFLNLGLELVDSQKNSDKKVNSFDKINQIMRSHLKDSASPSFSKNAPVRLEARVVCEIAKVLEMVDDEEYWLTFYQDATKHLKEFSPAKASQWINELRRLTTNDAEGSIHLKGIVAKLIQDLPNDRKKALESITTPQVVSIESIKSITTIGRREVPNGSKDLSIGKKRLMVMRKAA